MENPETIKLSVIVPVYNVKPYLTKCVDSLLNQDISKEHYEIILVDDGSTDGSADLLEQLQQNNTNVKVLHQNNQGVSMARNNGMELARGEYIYFADADDYLVPNVLNRLLSKMDEQNLDVLRFNYVTVNERGETINPYKYKTFDNYKDEVCDGLTFLNERLGVGCYVWQFIFKRQFMHLKFTEGISLGEDTDWTIRLMLEAKRVTSTDAVVYNYLFREGSATLAITAEKKRKKIEDQLWIVAKFKNIINEIGSQPWFVGQIAATVVSLMSSVAFNFYDERGSYINRLQQLDVLPISDFHLSSGAKRKRLLINISPKLFCFLIHFLRR